MKNWTKLLFMVLIISTLNLYGRARPDSLFIERHVKLRNLVIKNPSEALEEAYKLKSNNPDVSDQGLAFLIMGNTKWALGEFPGALKYYYEALKLFEQTNNTYGKIATHNDVSLIYIEEKDYGDGLESLHKARDLNSAFESKWLDAVIYSNIGDVFLRTNQLDSAWHYTDLSFSFAKQVQDSSLYAFILKNLSLIHLKQGNLPLARKRFNEGLEIARTLNDAIHNIEIVEVAGDYFVESDELDSAFKYYRQALEIAESLDSKKKIWSSRDKLKILFEKRGQYDSAYFYSKKVQLLKDSILGADKIRLTDHYEQMEELREEHLKAEEERRLEARQHLMEYMVIGIVILTLIGISFMFRKIKIRTFWFEAFLIVILLMIFECITLIVHTYAAEITHHSPILMLLILVVIASFLGPLHHHSVKHAKKLFITGD